MALLDNIMSRGIAALQRALVSSAAQPVLYSRGTDEITVYAVRGRTEFEEITQAGAAIKIQVDDFVVSVSDLVIGDVRSTPMPGDRIVVETPSLNSADHVGLSVTNASQTFEVRGVAGQAAWRFSDQLRTLYRIHTKLVDNTPSAELVIP